MRDRRTRRLMPVVALLVGLVAAGAAGCGSGGRDGGSSGALTLRGDPVAGRRLAEQACQACHSFDGSQASGGTFQGLAGSRVPLADGTTVTADRAYLVESIRDPRAREREGAEGVMPSFERLTDTEVADLVAFIERLGSPATTTGDQPGSG